MNWMKIICSPHVNARNLLCPLHQYMRIIIPLYIDYMSWTSDYILRPYICLSLCSGKSWAHYGLYRDMTQVSAIPKLSFLHTLVRVSAHFDCRVWTAQSPFWLRCVCLCVSVQLTMWSPSPASASSRPSSSGASGPTASPAATTRCTSTSPSGTRASRRRWRLSLRTTVRPRPTESHILIYYDLTQNVWNCYLQPY